MAMVFAWAITTIVSMLIMLAFYGLDDDSDGQVTLDAFFKMLATAATLGLVMAAIVHGVTSDDVVVCYRLPLLAIWFRLLPG